MIRTKLSYLFILLFSVIFLAACETRRDDRTLNNDPGYNKDRTTTNTDNVEKWEPTQKRFYNDNKNYTYEQREEWKADMEKRKDELDKEIDKVEKLEDNSTGAREKLYEARIADLKEKRDKLDEQIDKYDDTSAKNWNKFKSGVKSAWNDVEVSWNKLVKDIKSETNSDVHTKSDTKSSSRNY